MSVHPVRLLLVQLLRRVLRGLAPRLLPLLGLVLQTGRHEAIRSRVLPLHGLRWLGRQLLLLRDRVVRLGGGEGVERDEESDEGGQCGVCGGELIKSAVIVYFLWDGWNSKAGLAWVGFLVLSEE